jgi:glutamyl-tRNA synthetase
MRTGSFLRQRGIETQVDGRLTKVVKSLQPRAKTLVEMAEMAEFYFTDDFPYDEKGKRKFLRPGLSPFLASLIAELRGREDFDEATLEKLFRRLSGEHDMKLHQTAQGVRVALTGKTTSPGLFEVMEGIGRERVIKRLERAQDYIGAQSAGHVAR